MEDKILKIIKALVQPLAIICLIAFVLLVNAYLLNFINHKSTKVQANKIVSTDYQQNIKGSLVKAIVKPNSSQVENNDDSDTNETQIKTDNSDQLTNQIFGKNDSPAVPKLGVNMHWAAREDPCRDITLNEIIYSGKIKYAREEFNWNLIEPTPGQMDYSRYDKIIENYRHFGVEVLGLLTYSASWAAQAPQDAENKQFYPPDPNAWENFVSTTVSRYQGKVSAWEIWNEPNDLNFFKGSQQQYFELLRQTAEIIKAVDPQSKVISGGTTWPDNNYARNFYQAGLHKSIDGYGVHAYYCEQAEKDGDYEKLAQDLAQVIALAQSHGKKIWITEFGCSSYQRGQKKQADNLAYMMTLFNAAPEIEQAYWYALRDTNHPDKEGNFGLITKDLTLKQSFQAFKYFNP